MILHLITAPSPTGPVIYVSRDDLVTYLRDSADDLSLDRVGQAVPAISMARMLADLLANLR